MPGVQIDFDSPTGKLGRYARWLAAQNAASRDVGSRVRIISATGLGDWLTARVRPTRSCSTDSVQVAQCWVVTVTIPRRPYRRRK